MQQHHAQALNPAFDQPVDGRWTATRARSVSWVKRRARLEHVALGLIVAISLGLGLIRIGEEGYANAYYAAAVRSMLQDWHAFFFASYDAKGFVTVDKPPAGLWIQTASAWLFGYHGWSILLPQILASTGSVLLIFTIVRKPFGAIAGLLAALALAVAPVNVAVARNNSSDDVLAFFMLLGGVCVLRAARQGSLRWLSLAMVSLGVGFNIKMLEAYLALPACVAVYLLAANAGFVRRVWHLAVAAVVLIAVSFSWATAVALTPASARPYIGSTQDNSIFSLIFGYNGINRLLPRGWSIFGITYSSTSSAGAFRGGGGVGGASENGPAGVFRLLNTQLGGQIGWLIPLALAGLVVAWGRPRLRNMTDRQRVLLLLGVWAATEITFFSVAGFYHRYYMATLSPSIAGLVGAGAIALWRAFRAGGWRSVLMPAALIGTAASQYRLLDDYPAWRHRLAPVLIAGAACVLAAFALRFAIARRNRGTSPRGNRIVAIMATAAVLTLLAAPTIWSYTTTEAAGNGTMPVAGPSPSTGDGRFGGRGFGGNFGGGNAGNQNAYDASLISYLEQNQASGSYLLAVTSSQQADQIIISTGKPVMAMGGFSGSDPILSLAQLKQLIQKGEVRFFMLSGRGGFGFGGNSAASGVERERPSNMTGREENSTFPRDGADRPDTGFSPEFGGAAGGIPGGGNASQSISQWVQASCSAVPSTSTGGVSGLYDCKAGAS